MARARFQTVAHATNLGFECPKCGKKTEQSVAWLVDKDILPCGSCGHGIDLKDPDTHRRIEEVARDCARAQAALTKAGDLA